MELVDLAAVVECDVEEKRVIAEVELVLIEMVTKGGELACVLGDVASSLDGVLYGDLDDGAVLAGIYGVGKSFEIDIRQQVIAVFAVEFLYL